jgi:hypothetical protein
MDHFEYDRYTKRFAGFMESEGIENLSSDPHGEDCPRYGKGPLRGARGRFMRRPMFCQCEQEPHFSYCDVCDAHTNVERASGYNRTTKEVQVYGRVCSDCLYFAEYGKLDDMTMEDVEKSRENHAESLNLPLGEHGWNDCDDSECARVECWRQEGLRGLDMDGRPVYGPHLPPLPAWAHGGYTVIYYVKGENSGCRHMGEEVFCAGCATTHRDMGDEVLESSYQEGPIVECGDCGRKLISDYGDPDCAACDGDVSGFTNAGAHWECPACANPDAPWYDWMRAAVEKAMNE